MDCQQLDDASTSLQQALRIKRMGYFQEAPENLAATISRLASLQEARRGRIAEALATQEAIFQLHSTYLKQYYLG